MNLSTALDQFGDICSNALSNATFLDKKEKAKKPLRGRLKRLILEIILLYVVLPRKINFTQMAKYGTHTEKTYRQAFRTGYFWSGCASCAKWGLEILGIAAINIDLHDSFALKAVQTPDQKTLDKAKITLYRWYADVVVKLKEQLMTISKYIVADAAFSNKTFIDKITKHGFHLVSRLRDDCRIQYIYNGPKKKGKGRPRKYDGFVDKRNIDASKVEEFSIEGLEGKFFTFIGHHTAMKRDFRIVIWQLKDGSTKVFFSTSHSTPRFLPSMPQKSSDISLKGVFQCPLLSY